MYSENCSNYEGVCSPYLQQLTNINTTLITLSNNMLTEEMVLETIDNITANNVSEECSISVASFICQHAYPPCDGNGPLLITQEQCIKIRDHVCASEWRIAMTTESGPLDDVITICEAVVMEQPLQCHYQFKNFCGMCWPLCGSFSPYTDQSQLRQKALIISASTIALIGGIIVYIFAIMRRSKM